MDPVTIVGVDPGDTVGVFTAHVRSVIQVGGVRWRCDTSAIELNVGTAYDVIEALCLSNHHVIVACERYVITSRTARLTQQTTALEFIGGLKRICRQQAARIEMQMKSNVVKIGSDDMLRRAGWYTPGKGHANDAARHALYRLALMNPNTFEEVISPGTIDPLND